MPSRRTWQYKPFSPITLAVTFLLLIPLFVLPHELRPWHIDLALVAVCFAAGYLADVIYHGVRPRTGLEIAERANAAQIKAYLEDLENRTRPGIDNP